MLARRAGRDHMTSKLPQLVETDWLHRHLDAPDLRVLDCTVFFRLARGQGGYESGRAAWATRHIPGAGFADLINDLSGGQSQLPFTMPSATQFADAMSRYGVGEGTRVVVYDARMSIWAARLWWMLRAFGFVDAAVLNGGWRKWTRERRPTSSEPSAYPPARFIARPRPKLIAGKREVQAAISDSGACILSALPAPVHAGWGTSRFTRPGRIPSSVNVPAAAIVERRTHAYLPAEELRRRFADVGATHGKVVITYCGAGIAACSSAFALTLLGVEDVSVYDGSLMEWGADPSLPMEAPARWKLWKLFTR